MTVHQLASFRDRLGAGELKRREAKYARRHRSDVVGNRILAREMHAYETRGYLARFIARPKPKAKDATPGAVFVGRKPERNFRSTLATMAALVGIKRFQARRVGQ